VEPGAGAGSRELAFSFVTEIFLPPSLSLPEISGLTRVERFLAGGGLETLKASRFSFATVGAPSFSRRPKALL
jgi:hypothetical protein